MVGSGHEQEQRKATWDSALLVPAAVSGVRQSQRQNKTQEKVSLESFSLEPREIPVLGNCSLSAEFLILFIFSPAAPFPPKAES